MDHAHAQATLFGRATYGAASLAVADDVHALFPVAAHDAPAHGRMQPRQLAQDRLPACTEGPFTRAGAGRRSGPARARAARSARAAAARLHPDSSRLALAVQVLEH